MEAQERRDRAPRGLYRRLVEEEVLIVAGGAPRACRRWWTKSGRSGSPRLVVCDRFRRNELVDALAGLCRLETRVSFVTSIRFRGRGAKRRIRCSASPNCLT